MLLTDAQISSFLLVFCRISALMLTDVIMGSRFVPSRYRLLLALSLSAAVFPLVNIPLQFTMFSLTGFTLILQQLLIGVAIGAVFQLIFHMTLFGGQLIAYQMGLGFAKLTTPNAHFDVSMVGEIYYLAAMLLFIAQNGHLMVVEFLVNSFQSLPLTSLHIPNLSEFTQFAGIIFVGGLSIALPAITALIIVNTTFAIMTRSAPQINIFNIGFPITLMLGFVVIFLTFPGIMNSMLTFFSDGFTFLKHALRTP